MEGNQKIILLIEHKGGMSAFRYFVRECLENLDVEYDVYFFQRIPHLLDTQYKTSYCLYRNEVETEFVKLSEIGYGNEIIIISDAGAVGNYLDYERITKTLEFICVAKVYGSLTWLNPMPKDRRLYNSAEYIEKAIPMQDFDAKSLLETVKNPKQSK